MTHGEASLGGILGVGMVTLALVRELLTWCRMNEDRVCGCCVMMIVERIMIMMTRK